MSEAEDSVDRILTVRELEPDAVEEYVEAHQNVPSAVTEAMDRGGIERYDLFLHDGHAISYIVGEDLDAFREIYTADPDCQEWEERMDALKKTDSDGSGIGDRIWSFERDDGA